MVNNIGNVIAPDQNRTDTRSLEGYCSTIELQARLTINIAIPSVFFAMVKKQINAYNPFMK